jgi:hypothetical protein
MNAKNSIRVLSLLALPALLTGCVTGTASYRPSAATSYASRYRATLYRIVVDTHQLGTVKVYSEGGYSKPAEGSQPVIDVRLRIRNLSDAPIQLDLAKSDLDVDTDSASLVIKQPVRTIDLEPVPPGGIGRIALFYPLPEGVKPDDVNSFDFNWELDTSKGMYANTTSFLRREYQNTYVYYPLYDGWWGYPGWDWGWGPGWGWGPYGGLGWTGPYDWDRGGAEHHHRR